MGAPFVSPFSFDPVIVGVRSGDARREGVPMTQRAPDSKPAVEVPSAQLRARQRQGRDAWR